MFESYSIEAVSDICFNDLMEDIAADDISTILSIAKTFAREGQCDEELVQTISLFHLNAETILNSSDSKESVINQFISLNRAMRSDAVRFNVQQCLRRARNRHFIQRNIIFDTDTEEMYSIPWRLINALFTGAIALYRFVTLMESKPKDNPTEIITDKCSSLMKSYFDSSAEMKSLSQSLEYLLRSLGSLEMELIHSVGVPAFDCIYIGSFIQYLSTRHVDTLTVWLDKTLISFQYNANSSAAVIDDIDSDRLQKSIAMIIRDEGYLNSDTHQSSNIWEILSNVESQICLEYGKQYFNEIAGQSFNTFIEQLMASDEPMSTDLEDIKQYFHSIQTSVTSFDKDARMDQDSNPPARINHSLFRYSNDFISYIVSDYLSSLSIDDKSALTESLLTDRCIDHVTLYLGLNGNGTMPMENYRMIEVEINEHMRTSKRQDRRILSFPIRQEATFDDNMAQSDGVQRLLSLLSQCPYGISISRCVHWKEFSQHRIYGSSSRTILEFIAEHDDDLRKIVQNRRYLAISNDDCICVPSVMPSFDRLYDCLKERDYKLIGSYIIATLEDIIDMKVFAISIRSCFMQYEGLGELWLEKLFDLSIHVTFQSHQRYQIRILELIIQEVALCGSISASYCKKQLIDYIIASKVYADYLMDVILMGMIDESYSDWSKLTRQEASSEGLRLDIMTVTNTSQAASNPRDGLQIAGDDVDELTSGLMAAEDDNHNSLMASEQIESCRQFIEQLLVRDFEYSIDGKRPSTLTANAKKLQNALQHLSSKLYANDVHFVMELIQNADDNIYPVNTLPTLELKLYQGELLVYNNENGFSNDNITALCSVGASTKAGKKGYIGQKGIG